MGIVSVEKLIPADEYVVCVFYDNLVRGYPQFCIEKAQGVLYKIRSYMIKYPQVAGAERLDNSNFREYINI